MVEKFVINRARVGDGRAVPKELQGIATELFDGEDSGSSENSEITARFDQQGLACER